MFKRIKEMLGIKDFREQEIPSKKVLVVEDNAVERQFLIKTITKFGHQVETAENGQAGLEKVRSIRPDLILLDYEMPVMDGRQMCQHLKEDEAFKDIPVIFLTSRNTPKDVIDCYEADAENYLNKPVTAKILKLEIDTVFSGV